MLSVGEPACTNGCRLGCGAFFLNTEGEREKSARGGLRELPVAGSVLRWQPQPGISSLQQPHLLAVDNSSGNRVRPIDSLSWWLEGSTSLFHRKAHWQTRLDQRVKRRAK